MEYIKCFLIVSTIIGSKFLIILIAYLTVEFSHISYWWLFLIVPLFLFLTNYIIGFKKVICPICKETKRGNKFDMVFIDMGPCLEACWHYKCINNHVF